MNSRKLTLFSGGLFLIALGLCLFQYFSKDKHESDFTCRANFSIFYDEEYYVGAVQLSSVNDKGVITMLGIYSDKNGNKTPVRLYNDLNVKRNENLFTFLFLSSHVEPVGLSDNANFTRMLMPYFMKGGKSQAIYHIYTLPNGHKAISIGKLPVVLCHRID
ncbi:hypothetical protein [Entomohabitans teleogrylli]|uniref:hypothetical protein n=1 Tax=Entomohabitans teleogrylli TaxID=1384589 RepID=UPI00073D7404|nr:hypothetical protein [Entomohabitans teleogrylli]